MVFSFYVGSFVVFGISAIAHAVLLTAIVITVATFETAKRGGFKLRLEHKSVGYHSPGRSRQYMWINGEKIKLPEDDPGGEHE